MATKVGIDSMWANQPGRSAPTRVELRGASGPDVTRQFSTEVGIGQYPVTVLDHANGMATFAAAGKRADAHFVRSVSKRGDQVYAEKLGQRDIGLNQEQINQLNWTLRQVEAAKLPNGWDCAGKTGTWQRGDSLTENAHTWMVGYTGALATAVWLGTADGKALVTKDGSHDVFGANYPGAIWRQFMVDAPAALKLDKNKYRFAQPAFAADRSAPPTSAKAATATPSCRPPDCPSPRPGPSRSARPPASSAQPTSRPSSSATRA
jgi:membrane peptidoglycan carboxypeptidase